MAQMPYVCLYLSYLESFRGLSDPACGKLVKAMLRYAATGEEAPLTGPAKILWPSIRSQLERDGRKYRDRCEINRLNGARGGRPPKNQSVISETEWFFEKPKKPKEKEKEKEKENNNDNNKDKENANANEKESVTLQPPAPVTRKDWEAEVFARRAEKLRREKSTSGENGVSIENAHNSRRGYSGSRSRPQSFLDLELEEDDYETI